MIAIEFILTLLATFKDNFEDYILIISIMFLFLYQVINTKIAKKASKKTHDISDIILKNQSETVPSISNYMFKIVGDSATINRELDKIVYKLGADRGSVYLFHNSGHNLLGQPFAKVSSTNESLSPGIGSLTNSMNNIPIGILSCYIEDLLKDSEIKCPDIENYKNYDKTTYERLKNLEIKSTYATTMFSSSPECYLEQKSDQNLKDDIPLGFICIDYIKKKKELTKEEMELLNNASMTIKGLLIEQRREELQKLMN